MPEKIEKETSTGRAAIKKARRKTQAGNQQNAQEQEQNPHIQRATQNARANKTTRPDKI